MEQGHARNKTKKQETILSIPMTVQEDKRLTTILQAHSGYFHPPHPQPRTFPLYIARTTSQEESCHCCAPNAFPQERHVLRFLHLSGKPHHLPEIRPSLPKRNKVPHDSCVYAGNQSPFLAETTEMRIRHPSLPKPHHQTLYLESLFQVPIPKCTHQAHLTYQH